MFMNQKHGIEVVIQNKTFTLSGFEEEEYLQTIASYLNTQYHKLKLQDGYAHLDADVRSIQLQLNIAEDYFNEKKKAQELKEMNDQKNEELFEIKHEIIATRTELNAAKDEIELLKKELDEANKKMMQFEIEAKKA